MKKLSKTSQALAWMREAPGRTQYAASIQFSVAQSAVSTALSAERKTVEHYLSHRDQTDAYVATNDLTHLHGMGDNAIQRALRGRTLYHSIPEQTAREPGRMARALDWFSVHGGSQVESAVKFGVRPSGLSTALRIERGTPIPEAVQARRAAMRAASDPVRTAREECAVIADALGAPFVAQTIRGMT